jgi:hypothetical protein
MRKIILVSDAVEMKLRSFWNALLCLFLGSFLLACQNDVEPLPTLSPYWKQLIADSSVTQFDTTTYHLSNGSLMITFPPSQFNWHSSSILYQKIPNGSYTISLEINSNSPSDVYFGPAFSPLGQPMANVQKSGTHSFVGTVSNDTLTFAMQCENKPYPVVALLSGMRITDYKPLE